MSDETQGEAKAFTAMRELVGSPIAAPAVAPDPVNQPMIRHWVAAMEDHNPVYTDAAFAAATRFGGIVSPPMMLQTWTMPTPKITGIAARGGSPTEGAKNPLTQFGVRDPALSPPGRGRHVDDGDRIGLRPEADAPRARPLHHMADDVS
jgi:hypothetical protein